MIHVDDVDRQDLLDFATDCLKKGQKGKSIYNKLVVISQVMKLQGKAKLLKAADWPSFVETVRPIYENAELEKLFKACAPHEEMRFKFYLMSGFRDAEGRFVTWRDVDFKHMAVRVTAKPLIVPALLLFEDFYGKGWRSSVRWLMWAYVVFATIAFANIVIHRRPDLTPTAGIGIVFLLPGILLLGRLMGYRPPHVQDQSVLSLGLLALFLTFAHDRVASARLFDWHANSEPYGLFVLICCLG